MPEGTIISNVEAKLRDLEFDHDMREGAPRCRWVLGNLTVDIMSDGRRVSRS